MTDNRVYQLCNDLIRGSCGDGQLHQGFEGKVTAVAGFVFLLYIHIYTYIYIHESVLLHGPDKGKVKPRKCRELPGTGLWSTEVSCPIMGYGSTACDSTGVGTDS